MENVANVGALKRIKGEEKTFYFCQSLRPWKKKKEKKISELLIKLLLPEQTRIGKPLLLANLPTMSAVVLSFTVSRAKRRY